jgi:hypothetical protein
MSSSRRNSHLAAWVSRFSAVHSHDHSILCGICTTPADNHHVRSTGSHKIALFLTHNPFQQFHPARIHTWTWYTNPPGFGGIKKYSSPANENVNVICKNPYLSRVAFGAASHHPSGPYNFSGSTRPYDFSPKSSYNHDIPHHQYAIATAAHGLQVPFPESWARLASISVNVAQRFLTAQCFSMVLCVQCCLI